MERPVRGPSGDSARDHRPGVVSLGRLVLHCFLAHGMTVYASALAYRGLLALVPLALIALSLVGLFGIEGSLPRLTRVLIRLGGSEDVRQATGAVPLEGLLSTGAVVGIWSISTGARLLIRALNTAYGVDERRAPLARMAFSAVFVPALAGVMIAATALLLVASRTLGRVASYVGLAPVVEFLGSWLRVPVAFALLGAALAAVYGYAPSARPSLRAVVAGAGLALVLWAAVSLAFSLALSTVIDYGSTYGALGAAVALLVYLNLSALVVLLGGEVSAVLWRGPARMAEGGAAPTDAREP